MVSRQEAHSQGMKVKAINTQKGMQRDNTETTGDILTWTLNPDDDIIVLCFKEIDYCSYNSNRICFENMKYRNFHDILLNTTI